MPIKPKLLTRKIDYLLEDRFEFDKAAGSVNNSLSTGGQLRTVNDPSSHLSISGGQLVINGGESAWGNPGLWYPAQVRVAGKVLLAKWNIASGKFEVGWDVNQSTLIDSHNFYLLSNQIQIDSGALPNTGAYVVSTNYTVAIVLRKPAGAFYFIKGGAFANWTLLFASATDSTATLYPSVSNYSAAIPAADDIIIPAQLWLPTSLLADAFTRADGAIGNSDGINSDGIGCPFYIWQTDGGTWAISGNGTVGTPTVPTTDTTASVDLGTTNVIIDVKVASLTALTAAGIYARMDATATPANYLRMGFDGSGNVVLKEVIVGTPNTLLTVVKAMSANDTLRLDLSAAAFRAYHITSSGTAVLLGSGTTARTAGTIHGMFMNAANKIVLCDVRAKGNENQYSVLDQLVV